MFSIDFSQIDRIVEIEQGKSIRCVRTLVGDETYLRDHFPLFPVMPGVMILESLFQSAAWLLRYSNDFHNTIVELREVRNVKFQDFVEPGMELTLEAKIVKQDGEVFTIKGSGSNDRDTAVSARMIMECYSFGDRDSSRVMLMSRPDAIIGVISNTFTQPVKKTLNKVD